MPPAFHRLRELLVVALLSLLSAHAQAQAQPATHLRHDLRIDLPLLFLGAGIWLAGDAFKGNLAPDACRLCKPNELDQRVRDAAVWERTGPAATASDVIGLYTVPTLSLVSAGLLGMYGNTQDPYWVDALIWGEAVGLSTGLTQIVKFSFARRRPVVHERSHAAREQSAAPSDNVSFYSGHTSLAFSSVVAAGTLAWLRKERAAPFIFGIGLPLAGLTGYLRMAADQHYLSDVVMGAVMGSAFGALVPWLHRQHPELPALSLGPVPGTLAVTFRR